MTTTLVVLDLAERGMIRQGIRRWPSLTGDIYRIEVADIYRLAT